MYRSAHSASRALGGAAAIAASLALILSSQTMAHWDQPSYIADVAPGSVAAGTHSTTTLTVTQYGADSSQRVKSLRITPPTGFDLTSATAVRGSTALTVGIASGVVTIDSVGLSSVGQTAVVTLGVDVACGVSGDKVWTVVARNSSPFSASGHDVAQVASSDLTQGVDRCSFKFADQPKSAAVNSTITNEVATPSGPPITLQLLDGNGAPASQSGVGVSIDIVSGTGAAGATLGGTTADTTNSNGVARLLPTIDKAGNNYRLGGTSTTSGVGSAADDSNSFDINDVAVVCSGDCSGTSQEGNTGATVNANSNGGVLTFSLGVGNVDCNNAANRYYEGSSEAITFDVTGGTGRTEVTMKLDRSAVTKPVLRYDVCFSSPNSSFQNKFFKRIAAGDAGLLPFCINPLRPRGEPCVILKWYDRQGNVLVRFSVPAGDPRGKI